MAIAGINGDQLSIIVTYISPMHEKCYYNGRAVKTDTIIYIKYFNTIMYGTCSWFSK